MRKFNIREGDVADALVNPDFIEIKDQIEPVQELSDLDAETETTDKANEGDIQPPVFESIDIDSLECESIEPLAEFIEV